MPSLAKEPPVYMAVYALLSAAGGWIAWRNNPMYSNRSTVRFVALVGLTVAAYVAAIIAAVDFTAGHAVAVQSVTLFVTVLIGTLALIAVMIEVSKPPAPPLPPAVRLVNVYRTRLRPWAWRFVWTMLGFVVPAALLPGDLRDVAVAFWAIAAYIGINLLAAGYLSARQYDRALSGLEAEPWLHWTYSSQAWKAWIDVESARMPVDPQLSWVQVRKPLGLAQLGIGAGIFAFNPGPWLYDAIATFAAWGMIGGILAIANANTRALPRRLRRRLAAARPEVYFGSGGVFVDGSLIQWQTPAGYLVEATVDERAPRSIALTFEKVVLGAGSMPVVQYVLIPAGDEAGLARLQTSLPAVCPDAHIALA